MLLALVFGIMHECAAGKPAVASVIQPSQGANQLPTPARVAVAGYRVNRALSRRGLGGVAKILKYLVVWFCGIEINYKTRIGRNFQLHHGYGTIVSGTLGDNVHVNQGVTIGGNWGRAVGERSLPVIGNNVWIMAGAKVLGPITIGNNVLIGANAVVLSDVPDNSVVAGVPGRVLRPISGADLEMLTRMER